MPVGQLVQELLELDEENLPAGHTVQNDWPVEENFPAEQDWHDPEFINADIFPPGHKVHVPLPAEE